MIVTDYDEDEDGTRASVVVFGAGTAAITIAMAEGCNAEAACCDNEQVDELKPNMNFYQTKMHRRKKGGKVSFR